MVRLWQKISALWEARSHTNEDTSPPSSSGSNCASEEAFSPLSPRQDMDLISPIIQSHPAAVIELTHTCQFISGNPRGEGLFALLQSDASAQTEICLLIKRAGMVKHGVNGRITLRPKTALYDTKIELNADTAPGLQSYDMQVIPLDEDANRALICARNVTAEANLTAALTASRELYRDLVSCSTDFAWETDTRGIFVFTSKKGALGYTASDLNGFSANDLIATEKIDWDITKDDSPFLTETAIDNQEIWLLNRDGEERCMLMSAIPILDKDGTWRGARGVGRDITRLRAQEREIARTRKREEAVSKVVKALNSELQPLPILRAAAETTMEATQAFRCHIYRTKDDLFFATPSYCLEASFGNHSSDKNYFLAGSEIHTLASHLQQAANNDLNRVSILIDEWSFLVAFTKYCGRINGAIAIAKPLLHPNWSEDTYSILDVIAEQVGIGIAQANQIDDLQTLSRKDPLTDLLNRRAFMDEAGRRRSQHVRKKRHAAMLYLDCDNFKYINDLAGHKGGDAILVTMARLFAQEVRRGDLIVRFGGDEFGIWLEETDAKGACKKADDLLHAVRENILIGPDKTPAKLSIGIATFDPQTDEPLSALIDRADRGLYKAKLKGKDCWHLAPPANQPEDQGREVLSC